ncbi:MAG: hypothetical protein HDS02_03870, partial [Bacteroides sp.]|nr:hypothetical protein [Bacteroides sp.]
TAIAQTHIIDYVGNKIYEDGRLNKILVDGGYVDYNGGNPVYNAYMTDYQGNIRMVVSESAAVRQAVNYYPYGALMTTGPSINVQRYMYNGKELDRMHGLDWYDYGARHYDAAIGRWHSMDDMCYAYYDISPYAYCGGDPVNAIDPDGRSVWTKVVKIGAKIGSKVSRSGLSALFEAASYAEAVSDITDDVNTVFDSNASLKDRLGAGLSLASEILPVSVGDVKDTGKLIEKIVHGNSKASARAQHWYDIINKSNNEKVKIGVSGGKISKKGKSYRAERQVRKWNREEGGDGKI